MQQSLRRIRVPCLIPLTMPAIGTPTYAELDAVLTKLDAKLTAREVHALYLGGLTSTDFGLGPQRLLERILGEDADIGENPMDVLQVILGYWNTLVTEKEAGRVRLAPYVLPEEPTKADLLVFVKQRHEELAWFLRGIDAGGDDPMEFGPAGQRGLEAIAQGAAYLSSYVEVLNRDMPTTAAELKDTGHALLEMVATLERLIADLMDVSDAVRREALATYAAKVGTETDDGVPIARPIKVGRNDKCPCGSGKKWKKCCGASPTMQ